MTNMHGVGMQSGNPETLHATETLPEHMPLVSLETIVIHPDTYLGLGEWKQTERDTETRLIKSREFLAIGYGAETERLQEIHLYAVENSLKFLLIPPDKREAGLLVYDSESRTKLKGTLTRLGRHFRGDSDSNIAPLHMKASGVRAERSKLSLEIANTVSLTELVVASIAHIEDHAERDDSYLGDMLNPLILAASKRAYQQRKTGSSTSSQRVQTGFVADDKIHPLDRLKKLVESLGDQSMKILLLNAAGFGIKQIQNKLDIASTSDVQEALTSGQDALHRELSLHGIQVATLYSEIFGKEVAEDNI